MSTTGTRAKRILRRVRETAADMNYAQRRLVEIKLGVPPEASQYCCTEDEEIDELEALFELEPVSADAENPA